MVHGQQFRSPDWLRDRLRTLARQLRGAPHDRRTYAQRSPPSCRDEGAERRIRSPANGVVAATIGRISPRSEWRTSRGVGQDMTARWMRILGAAGGGRTPLDEAVAQISAIREVPEKKSRFGRPKRMPMPGRVVSGRGLVPSADHWRAGQRSDDRPALHAGGPDPRTGCGRAVW